MNLKNLNINLVLFVIIIITTLFLFKECKKSDDLQTQLFINNQNQMAQNDSVRVILDKFNNEIFIKKSLIADIKDLKKLNSSLLNEIKNIPGNVEYIEKVVTEIETDTLILNNEIIKNSDRNFDLYLDLDTIFSENNSRILSIKSNILVDSLNNITATSKLTRDLINMSFITGLTEYDDYYEIFVKSDYPGFKVTNIEGSIVNKKRFTNNQRSIVFGPYLGVGIGYDPFSKTMHPGLSVGFGMTYNLNKHIKK